MSRKVKIGAAAVAVLIIVGLILPRLVNVNSFRPKLESELSAALGRQVKVGNLSLSIFSGTVSADDISIGDDPAFSQNPFVTAKSLNAGAEIMPLIFKKTLHITGIKLVEPTITLLRGANGTWNFSSLGRGSSGAPSAPKLEEDATAGQASGGVLSVDRLNVDNGRLLVGTANSAEKAAVYSKVSLEVKNFSATAQFPFTFTAGLPGGGDLSVEGKCGPMSTGSAGSTPFEASMTVRNLDLAASGWVAPSTGIQGVADFDGTISSNGQQVKASGTLKAEKLKLAAKGAPSKVAVGVKYAVDHNLQTDAGTLAQGDIAIGKAVARLTGSYQTQGQTTAFNMKVDANNMPVEEIEDALPALGVVLPSGSKLQGGALSANLAIAGPADAPVITGPVRLSNAKLAGFDMGSKLSAIPALSGKQTGGKDTTIQNFSTTVRMAPDNIQANSINLTIPSLGAVTGAGTISPSGALNFALNADLSGGSGSGIIQKAGQGGGIPFGIEGTISDPKFVPNVAAMAGSAAKQAISEKVGLPKATGRLGRRSR